VHGFGVDVVDHGGEESGLVPGHACHLVDEGGGGGFAVCSGHAHQAEFLGGVAVPARGEVAQGACGVVGDDVCGFRLEGVGESLHNVCRHAAAGERRDEGVAVDGDAAHSHEHPSCGGFA